jgi:hypothetical protein
MFDTEPRNASIAMPASRPDPDAMIAKTLIAIALACAALAGCGGGGDGSGEQERTGDRPAAAKQRAALNGADEPRADQFPKPAEGQSLQQFADSIGATGTEVGLATSVFTPGHNRLAFGVIDDRRRFVYGPTAVYVARSPASKEILGPYPAPADLLVTEPAFRSRQAAAETDFFAAIYEVDAVELEEPGQWPVLVVTRVDGELLAAATQVTVRRESPVPEPREKAPVVDTETVAGAGGDVESIETRVPPDDMHDVSLRDVIGRKPVALVFATPQLCESRVCGPVVDIALQLKAEYGDRVAFIHQEVYVDNDPEKGLREPLRRYGLPTEPWLFTIDRSGRVAARLEGSFGLSAFKRAVETAIAQG